jgi:hypothetical protein
MSQHGRFSGTWDAFERDDHSMGRLVLKIIIQKHFELNSEIKTNPIQF